MADTVSFAYRPPPHASPASPSAEDTSKNEPANELVYGFAAGLALLLPLVACYTATNTVIRRKETAYAAEAAASEASAAAIEALRAKMREWYAEHDEATRRRDELVMKLQDPNTQLEDAFEGASLHAPDDMPRSTLETLKEQHAYAVKRVQELEVVGRELKQQHDKLVQEGKAFSKTDTQ